MIRRLATYLVAFLGAFTVWLGLAVVEAINPLIPYQYPVLGLFLGMGFPGGAPPILHYMNHVAETWFPFLMAFFIAKTLTKGRVRFWGCVMLYGAFLIWSFAMAWLVLQGMPLDAIFGLGLAGTFFGGAVLYLWRIDPKWPSPETY